MRRERRTEAAIFEQRLDGLSFVEGGGRSSEILATSIDTRPALVSTSRSLNFRKTSRFSRQSSM